MRRRALGVTAAAAATAVLLLAPSTAFAAEVENGSFESGTDGWTVEDWPQSAGTWDSLSGDTPPGSQREFFEPPCGDYAAVFDQNEPSSSVLYQDIVLEADMTHTLTFTHYFHNYAVIGGNEEEIVLPEGLDDALWISPDTLSIEGGEEFGNQQYRVDIIDPEADPFSLDETDVWASIYASQPGDPAVMEPTEETVDLSEFAGQTVRLRFAGADTEYYLNIGVDCVAVASEAIATTTTTAAPTTTTTAAVAAVTAPRFTG